MICRRLPADPSVSPTGRRTSLAAALALACGLALPWLGGCGERVEPVKRLARPGAPAPIAHRPVEASRDLPDIQREGVLRMATRPGPLTWMVFQGRQAGFERDLLAAFCDEWNLRLEPVLPVGGELLTDLLRDGRADVVADGLVLTEALEAVGRPTRPFGLTRLHVVLGPGPEPASAPALLDGLAVTVPWETQATPWLEELRDAHDLNLAIVRARPGLTTDDLLHAVADGGIQATVAAVGAVRSIRARHPELRLGPALGPRTARTWLVRRSSEALGDALDRFLARNYSQLTAGSRRSRLYGILYERYIGDPKQARYYQQDRLRTCRSGRITPWDELIRETSTELGLDWLVVASLIYEESRFDPDVVSVADAVGLMQVLPRFSHADSTQLIDPETNIRVGTAHLADIWRSYHYLAPEDRWPFTLATYHAGVGHMNDARRIAMDAELDPNRWEDNVEVALHRLRDRATATRHGYYRGDESAEYAESILRRAEVYRMALREARRRKPE